MTPLRTLALLLAFAAVPTQARASAFTFSFGTDLDIITGVMTGEMTTGLPVGYNWSATSILFTSMPAPMQSAYDHAGGISIRPDTLFMLNRWIVDDGEMIGGRFDQRTGCIFDCVHLRLDYGGNGLLFAAHPLDFSHIEQYTVQGPLTMQPVPEPATLTLFGLGLVGVVSRRLIRRTGSASRARAGVSPDR